MPGRRAVVGLLLVLLLLLAAMPLSVSAAGGTYVVKSGDTLAKIASAHGVSVNSIVAANGLSSPDLIYVGQRLVIPGGSGSAPAPPPAPANTRYTVRAGDTLGSIAARLGVSASNIAEANGLANPNLIYPGMKLIIPRGKAGVSAPAGRPTKFVASISQQRCWVYSGETIMYAWRCSTGRRASPTKAGTFRIQSKMPKAYGSTWNIWMPYWLGIYWAGASENGIHGMPWNAGNGRQTWPGLVGTPITYGCIMLSNPNAKALYDMAYIGMPVIIKR